MNEQDGYAMMLARCKALEEIALNYMTLHQLETGTHEVCPVEHKRRLESQIEKLAPGCSHQTT